MGDPAFYLDSRTGIIRPAYWRLKETTMAHGTIKKLNAERGFGFITDTRGVDWFFHSSGVANHNFDGLREGRAVTFEEGSGPKGPRAERVQLA